MIKRAFELQDKGLTRQQIAEELHNTNIGVYIKLRPILDRGELPEDKGSAYSIPACKDYIENYWNKPVRIGTESADVPNGELSAKDKKELAMYTIDQHYFFLKQLTGVI